MTTDGMTTGVGGAVQASMGSIRVGAQRLDKACLGRRPFNVVVAAVANKLARIISGLLGRNETYRCARLIPDFDEGIIEASRAAIFQRLTSKRQFPRAAKVLMRWR